MSLSRIAIATVLAVPCLSVAARAQTADSASQEKTTGQSATGQPSSEQPSQTSARTGAPTTAADIIVTAERRAVNVQDLPVAVTALDGDSLESQLVRGTQDLQASVPGLVVSPSNLVVDFALRGISTTPGVVGAVTFNRDGIYQATSAAAVGDYFDLERIEVLRGPQGTLYGNNSTAGAINLISNEAEPGFAAGGSVQVGGRDLFRAKGFINAQLGEGVYARVAGDYVTRDGFRKNVAGPALDDLDQWAVRPQLVIEPSDNFKLQIIGEFFRNRALGQAQKALISTRELYGITARLGPLALPNFFKFAGASPIPADDERIAVDVTDDTRLDYDRNAVTVRVEGDLPGFLGGAKLNLLAGYVGNDQERGFDADGTDAILVRAEQFLQSEQLSIESQLLSTGDGPFDWIVGAYYLSNRSQSYLPIDLVFARPDGTPLTTAPLLGVDVFPQFRSRGGNVNNATNLESRAIYGQASYDLTTRLTATLGLRYTFEDSTALYSQRPYALLGPLPPTSAEVSYDEPTGKAEIEYRATDDILAYAKVSRGFNQSGFNPVSGVGPKPVPAAFIWAYEGGAKTSFFDDRAIINVAGFYNDYTDLNQTQVIGATSLTDTGDAKILGAEAEWIFRPVDGFRIDGNATYLDTEYKNFAFTNPATGGIETIDGNQLVRAPKFSAAVGAQYAIPLGFGTLTPRVDFYYQDKIFFRADNNPDIAADSYTKTDATLTLRDSDRRFYLQAFVENIEDDSQIIQATASFAQLGGFPLVSYSAPRTYGVRLGFNF